MKSQPGQQTIATYILPNISQPDNETWSINNNKSNIFQKLFRN